MDVVTSDHGGRHVVVWPFTARRPNRQRLVDSTRQSLAVRMDRAQQTTWRCRGAESCTQLHQSLVEIAGAIGRHQVRSNCAQASGSSALGHVVGDGKQPGQYPLHVTIHRWYLLAEGDAGHRTRCVVAEARQVAQAIIALWQSAAVVGHYLASGGVSMPQLVPSFSYPFLHSAVWKGGFSRRWASPTSSQFCPRCSYR